MTMKKREVKSKQSSCVTDLADRADDGKASPLPCDPMEMKRKVNKRKRGYEKRKSLAPLLKIQKKEIKFPEW